MTPKAGPYKGPTHLHLRRASRTPTFASVGLDEHAKFVPADAHPCRLERPCMDHMQYLMVRSYNPDGKEFNHPMEDPDDTEHEHMSGHALMATAAPYSHVMQKPTEKYPHQMPEDLDNPTLVKLLDLSNRLPLDHQGEITPVMAWKLIYLNARVRDLTKFDFERMKTNLATKVRCYGFGAVLEEFEVCDALNGILAEKDGQMMPALDQKMAAQQISVH
ncbi:hypothetical protein AC578_549 [Pseudocercospora eumusae]|uniref:Uncharacterized protein n=1 Tax=Pseudocercospora eumusae TaxID=321146 RepID=A0A139HYN7_9PEZI|nr:hypothetical protein AC578_549 [Pseudocercospora eumusae]